MKSFFRYGVLAAIIMVLAASSVITTNAQASFCPKGLSADDCALLTGSKAAKTFVMDYTITAKLAGTPQDGDLSIKGSGPIDVSKIPTDPAAMSDMSKLLNGFLFQNTLEASANFAGQKQAGKIELRIVGGVIYFNGDVATKGKWMKVDLAKAMGSNPMTMSPTSLTKQMDPQLLTDLMSFVGDSLKGESKDGPDVDGVKTKQITISLDAVSFVKSLGTDKGAAIITKLSSLSGSSASAMDPKQLQQSVNQFEPMLEPTLKNTVISFSWLVDPAAKQYRGFSATIKTKVDPALAALASGGAGGAGGSPKAIDFDLEFSVTLSKLDAPVKVDPVADAVDANAK